VGVSSGNGSLVSKEESGLKPHGNVPPLRLKPGGFHGLKPQFLMTDVVIRALWYQALGCHPASAQSSPLTAWLLIMKQIASAISSGLISRRNCVYGRTYFSRYS
jgi:hypothetical protein